MDLDEMLYNEDILIPYEEVWVSENSFINKDLYEQQKLYYNSVLFFNESFQFLYDRDIQKFEEYIKSNIHDIKIVDTITPICNEVYFTSKIEGANTTIARTFSIHDGKPLDKNNFKSEKMVKNCFDATKYLNLISSHPFTEINLLTLWNIIVDGVCENEDIRGSKYRTGDICVGNHEGISNHQVESMMKIWLDFYNDKAFDDHPFIKACLLHYFFEYVHPFPDGNGRTGRMLMNHYLITHGYEQVKAISFSTEIDKNRKKYDVAFSDSENKSQDCTPFIKYMLSIMADAIYHCKK